MGIPHSCFIWSYKRSFGTGAGALESLTKVKSAAVRVSMSEVNIGADKANRGEAALDEASEDEAFDDESEDEDSDSASLASSDSE